MIFGLQEAADVAGISPTVIIYALAGVIASLATYIAMLWKNTLSSSESSVKATVETAVLSAKSLDENTAWMKSTDARLEKLNDNITLLVTRSENK